MTFRTRLLVLASLVVTLVAAPAASASYVQPIPPTPAKISFQGAKIPGTSTSRVTTLRITGLTKGSTTTVTCTAVRFGCPWARYTRKNNTGTPTLDLSRAFRGRALKPGVLVRVSVDPPAGAELRTRVVVAKVRRNASPLVTYGCNMPNRGFLITCSDSVPFTVDAETKTALGVAAAAYVQSHAADISPDPQAYSKLTWHEKPRASSLIGLNGKDYAEGVFTIGDENPLLYVRYVRIGATDTGDPAGPWSVSAVSRAGDIGFACTQIESLRDLWYPELMDPLACKGIKTVTV